MRHPITIPHHRWALVFAVLCLSLSAGAETLPQVAPEDVGLSSQRLERLTDVMQLQEEGRLLIDDPVSRYLPEFAETTVAIDNENVEGYSVVPADRPITIRDLLTHTGGIGYGPASDRWQAADIQKWYFAHRGRCRRPTRPVSAGADPRSPRHGGYALLLASEQTGSARNRLLSV